MKYLELGGTSHQEPAHQMHNPARHTNENRARAFSSFFSPSLAAKQRPAEIDQGQVCVALLECRLPCRLKCRQAQASGEWSNDDRRGHKRERAGGARRSVQ